MSIISVTLKKHSNHSRLFKGLICVIIFTSLIACQSQNPIIINVPMNGSSTTTTTNIKQDNKANASDTNKTSAEASNSDQYIKALSTNMDNSRYPVIDNDDVLVPHKIIEAIEGGFKSNEPVYAANDRNGWFVRGSDWATDSVKKQSEMTREGDMWRGKNLKGERFNVVQLKSSGAPRWAQIHNIYSPLDDQKFRSFIDLSGPCLKLK